MPKLLKSHRNKINFWQNQNMQHMQIDCQWCFGWCLGIKIWGRTGMHAYNSMLQQNLPACKQKLFTILCLPMQNLTINVNVHTHVFVQKKSFVVSSHPKLHGRSAMMVRNNAQCHLLLLDKRKNNAALIFTVPDIIAKFDIKSGTVKIGLSLIFSTSSTHRRHAPSLHI